MISSGGTMMSDIVKKAYRASSIIMIFTLASKLTGFFREALIASNFGISMEADAYNMSLTIPLEFGLALATAICTAVIPIFNSLLKKDKYQAYYFTRNIVNIGGGFFLFLSSIAVIFTPFIIRILAPGFQGDKFNLTILLSRFMIPVAVIFMLGQLLASIAYSLEEYTIPAIAPFAMNILLIIYLIFFIDTFGVIGLATATFIGHLLQLAIRYFSLRKYGFSYKPVFDFKDKDIRKLFRIIFPILVGSSIQELAVIVDRYFASISVAGSVSALRYADTLNKLAIGVFGTSIILVFFPNFSKLAADKDLEGLKENMKSAVNMIILIMVPITVGLIILRVPIIEAVYKRDSFGSTAAKMTSNCLLYYSIGLTALIIRDIFSRIYYSIGDAKTPMINAVIGALSNILFIFILIKPMSYMGLAFSTSLSYFVTMLLLGRGMKKIFNSFEIKPYVVFSVKVVFASVVMGTAVYFSHKVFAQIFYKTFFLKMAELLGSILLGIVVYLLICRTFKIDEAKQAIGVLKEKINFRKL